jgi:hypothetical protein
MYVGMYVCPASTPTSNLEKLFLWWDVLRVGYETAWRLFLGAKTAWRLFLVQKQLGDCFWVQKQLGDCFWVQKQLGDCFWVQKQVFPGINRLSSLGPTRSQWRHDEGHSIAQFSQRCSSTWWISYL